MDHLNCFAQNSFLTLYLVICICAVGVLISAFEWLSMHKHFAAGGLFSWEIRRMGTHSTSFEKLAQWLFSYPNVLILFFIQITATITIFISSTNHILIGSCCLIIALSSILLNFRATEGISGADKMTRLIMIIGSISFFRSTPLVTSAGLIFISLQLILAYCTAGWVRLFVPTWRNGTDLALVLRQHTYSNKFVWSLTKNNKLLLKFVALFILFFECSFLICPLLSSTLFYIYLGCGILFHLSNAFIMGLNSFVWSFLSTYPALIWLHYYITLF